MKKNAINSRYNEMVYLLPNGRLLQSILVKERLCFIDHQLLGS